MFWVFATFLKKGSTKNFQIKVFKILSKKSALDFNGWSALFIFYV